ncbi:conserved hypothetical protein [Ricinus communis]|uniref:Reverse transcriptase domain-containing protein n=1 Tax=Ricinus communis TaxID=3988 RepID=B9RSA2_RICCO|nr:conserved hypothetical protein [Ricinus communis]
MITPSHALRSCPTLSHLLFANDVLILYNGHKQNLKKLQIFLERSKKLIVMAKRGIENGSFPIKYLDVPSFPKRIKREHCLPLLENEKENLRLEKQIVVLRRSTKAWAGFGVPLGYPSRVPIPSSYFYPCIS